MRKKTQFIAFSAAKNEGKFTSYFSHPPGEVLRVGWVRLNNVPPSACSEPLPHPVQLRRGLPQTRRSAAGNKLLWRKLITCISPQLNLMV